MPVFLDDNRLDDRQRLLAAVDYLQEIVELSFASEHIKMPLLLFLRTAWSDILERNELDRVRARIREVPEAVLLAHGLTGRQLEMKRSMLGEWDKRFRQQRGAGWLKKLVGGLKSLFGSLLDALGIGGLLKEFLDFLLEGIEEYGETVG